MLRTTSLFSRYKAYVTCYIFFVLCSLFFVPFAAQAADPKPTIRDAVGYSAKYVSQSIPDPIEMSAGEERTITIKFKNTGTQTWNASGARYISAYTMEPRDRSSVFAGNTWKSKKQTNAIVKATKPGEVAELTFVLKAPSTPGQYTEEFYLAAENYSWVQGGYFFLKINVVTKTGTETVSTSSTISSTPVAEPLSARRSYRTGAKVSAQGGEDISYTLSYRNTGTSTWNQTSFRIISDEPSLFGDESWVSRQTIYTHTDPVVPGKFLRRTFTLRAPPDQGSYTVILQLVANGVVLNEMPLTVVATTNAPSSYSVVRLPEDTVVVDAEDDEDDTPRLLEEPYIRVGLFVVSSTVRVKVDDEYRIIVDGVDVAALDKGKTIRLTHDNGVFTARVGKKIYTGTQSLDLIPKRDPHTVFTITSYERMVTWKGPNNFNAYRGRLEMRKGEKSDDVWVVNELLMSDYAKGIGENSNGSPMEYLKAQSVAQVSYAYAIMQSDKYGIFDVVATTGDQLYLGYNCELLMPRFVQAVEATRGYMVTYNDEVVITPYFANTNGKTKSWTSVWGGSHKPWLVPVVANYDKGKRLLGHGVGMSQLDAAARADKEGLGWRELLKYYYTGTSVTKMFE